MVNRVVTSLFLGGLGLFRAKAMGRILFKDIGSKELSDNVQDIVHRNNGHDIVQ